MEKIITEVRGFRYQIMNSHFSIFSSVIQKKSVQELSASTGLKPTDHSWSEIDDNHGFPINETD
jgi:hypothetical protein